MRYLSLFSGIEAASAAWVPLGWEPVAFAEVEPFPCAVLRERFPEVPNLRDVTRIDWGGWLGAVGAVPDVLVGGSPCQSFSVAGDRTGLAGVSGLMCEYVRAVREVRPRWVVWENVPGALSSSRGEDFGCLLRELDDLGYGLAWRVLGSMFFGVAQRRRRVFLVGCLGDPRGPAQVLIEPHCLRWDSPSSRAKREELAARAGRGDQARGLSWHDGGDTGLSVGPTATAPDSTKPPACAIAANQRGELRLDGGDGQTVGAIPATRSGKQAQAVMSFVAGASQPTVSTDDLSPTIKSGSGGGSLPSVPSVTIRAAYAVRMREGCEGGGKGPLVQEDVSGTLARANDQTILCRASGQANAETCEGMSPALAARQHRDPPIVSAGWTDPRRLTPLECERLQGFPDGWTDVPYRGREHPADTPRYKAIGNSMAVPVMQWIGKRIAAYELLEGDQA